VRRHEKGVKRTKRGVKEITSRKMISLEEQGSLTEPVKGYEPSTRQRPEGYQGDLLKRTFTTRRQTAGTRKGNAGHREERGGAARQSSTRTTRKNQTICRRRRRDFLHAAADGQREKKNYQDAVGRPAGVNPWAKKQRGELAVLLRQEKSYDDR